jgi:polysaccharide export outer membrane protein
MSGILLPTLLLQPFMFSARRRASERLLAALPRSVVTVWLAMGLVLPLHAQNLKASDMLARVPDASATTAPAHPAAQTATERQPPLGLGDQITITVFGQPDMSAEVTVGDTGTITVPLVGTLRVSELTPAQLETLVAQRLKDGGYLQNPGVAVQVKQVRSQMVSVLGEVQRPGRFPLQGKMTVLEALALAGGLTARAEKSVLVLRKPETGATDRQEIAIQLDDAGGQQRRGQLDASLQNDDVVYVLQQKMFFIHGEVRKPGAYPVEPGLNIMKALSLSGGVSERGSMGRIRVHRKDAHQTVQEIKADPSLTIHPDDVIFVDERLF